MPSMQQIPTFYSCFFQFVTMHMPYTLCMNILTAFPVKGFFFTLLLFFFCIVGVHLVILARVGWEHQQKSTADGKPKTDEKPKEEKKPSLEREPIYYIVERKTKRAKASYGEPKQINFKP